MIQSQSVLKVADNSGAKTVRCIRILGGFKKKTGKLGDSLIVSVQNLRNKSKKSSKVKKKEVYKALIIRLKTKKYVKNGVKISFNENSVALINKQGNPVGTRIIGPISSKHFKNKKFQKIISISTGTL